jgi:rod shape-determining protein MreD
MGAGEADRPTYTARVRVPAPAAGRSICAVSAASQGASEIYTSILLALIAGVVHAGLAPVIEVAGVHPNLILVAVVLVASLLGFGQGVVWAFVGGLMANLLVLDPLGTLPLSLLLVAALVAGLQRVVGRLVWVFPVLACFAGSVLADLVKLGVYRLVDDPLRVGLPLDLIIPAAFLNAAILAVLLYPARVVTMRLVPEEAPAW